MEEESVSLTRLHDGAAVDAKDMGGLMEHDKPDPLRRAVLGWAVSLPLAAISIDVADASTPWMSAVGIKKMTNKPLAKLPLSAGIRQRHLSDINGLTVSLLEAA
jgi:hypothetical protein